GQTGEVGVHGVPTDTITPAPYGPERDPRAIPEAFQAPWIGFEPGGRGCESLPARQLSSWFRSLPSLLRSAPGGAAVAALSLLGVEARRRHCGFVPPRSS